MPSLLFLELSLLAFILYEYSNYLFFFFLYLAAIFSGYRTIEKSEAHKKIFDYSQALTDLKFTYVVSCQVYGNQKKSSDARDRSCANNILNLMLT